MTVALAFIAGALTWHFVGLKLIARFGLRRADIVTGVLDGLTLSQLNRLRAATDDEIQTRIRQADAEAAR